MKDALRYAAEAAFILLFLAAAGCTGSPGEKTPAGAPASSPVGQAYLWKRDNPPVFYPPATIPKKSGS
ncbi:MAG: hypothetical protein WC586_03635 [Methanoregula sp.]